MATDLLSSQNGRRSSGIAGNTVMLLSPTKALQSMSGGFQHAESTAEQQGVGPGDGSAALRKCMVRFLSGI